MSLTVEFYSAEPLELVILFSEYLASGDDLILSEKLQTYPMAEFPGRLLIPDDLNNLCSILMKYHPLVPPHFNTLCIKQLWNDGCGSETLTLLSDQFVSELATFSESEIEQAALAWAATFPLQEPLQQSLPYTGVLQLQTVARDTVVHKKSLLFYLAGVPGFFDYLRSL